MSDEFRAWRSTDPAVLRIYAESRTELDAWNEKALAEQERLGTGITITRGGFRRQLRVIGLEAQRAERDPDAPSWRERPFKPAPDGWVKYAKYDYYVPARGKAGEAARQWIEDMQPPATFDTRMVKLYGGLPIRIDGELRPGWPECSTTPAPGFAHHIHWPVYFEWDGAVWIRYRGSFGFGLEDGDDTDLSLDPYFQPCTVSEWYAAKEAADAAHKDEPDAAA